LNGTRALNFHVGTPYLAIGSLQGGRRIAILVPTIIAENGSPVQSVLATGDHGRLQETLV
jgi:hypothetical protein